MGTLAVPSMQGNQQTQLQGAMVLLESFPSFWHLAIRGPLWLVLLCSLNPSGAYRPPLGSCSVVHRIRDLNIILVRVILCCFAHQVLKGPPSLLCFSSLVLICAERGGQRWLHPPCVTQQYHPASRVTGFPS